MLQTEYKIGKRTTIRNTESQLSISIKMQPDFLIVIFTALAGVFFAAFTTLLIVSFRFSFDMLIIKVVFGGISLYMAYVNIWNFFGVENILLSSKKLVLEKSFRSIPLFRKEFDLDEVQNIKIPDQAEIIPSHNYSSDYFKISGGMLGFDYGNDLYAFGIDLTKREAKEILKIILNRVSIS